MFLKRFYEPKLAQASYLIGCAARGEAIVIDANRDVEQYVAAAQEQGARIAYVTETHIHADYVSGSRELAAKTDAELLLSDEGGPDWRYKFEGDTNIRRIKARDHVQVGNVRIDVLHTPGHTPEHVTFLVTDGAAADEPVGACTGDFIFAGDVGRPDLLERAAHIKGTMEAGARQLFQSLDRFRAHPDWLQIWPGHGAGSACGKGISAMPHTTLGYERRFNWAFQVETEDEFVRQVLAGQPEPPKYFAEMKRVNRDGPRLLNGFPQPRQLDITALVDTLEAGAPVIDTRPAAEFAVGHIPGTINIPLDASFTTWAGWLLPYTTDFYLIVDEARQSVATPVRDLALIGLDRIGGAFSASVVDEWTGRGPLATIPQVTVDDLRGSLEHKAVTLVDVRNDAEWQAGHIDGAHHITLGYLVDRLDEIPRDKPVVVQCAAGARSAIGASLLEARGFTDVINLTGGYGAWLRAGFPTTGGEREPAASTSGQ